MPFNSPSPKKNYYILIISLLTLVTFLALFVFRGADDNRLTSWQWVFAGVNVARIFLFLILGIIFAYVFSSVSFPERKPVLFLFFLSFVLCIPFWREPEVIVDASRYFTQAKHLEVYGIKYFINEWGGDINAWTDLPLVPFMYGLIFRFFGESRIYLQLFTSFLFSMTVVLTYFIGKTLWGENLGYFAGLLLLGFPYIFTQVPLMLVDVTTMFFLTLLIFAFISSLSQGGTKMIAFASVALFLTFFSKYSTWLMLSILVVIFLVYLKIAFSNSPIPPRDRVDSTLLKGSKGGLSKENGKMNRVIFYRTALIVLIAGLLIGVVFLYKFDVFSEQIKLLLSYQKPGLKRWGESFFSTFFYQMHPFVTIAGIYSIFVALKKKDLKYLIISWLVLLIVLLQIKRIRYIMIIFPMLALMASYGLQEIKTRELKKFLVSCAVVSSLIVAIFLYIPFLQRMSPSNLKEAGMFLDSIDAANVEVLTISSANHIVNPAVSVPILDLFTEKDLYYNYDVSFSPPFEKIKKSPLRFTWEYKNPEYYSVNKKTAGGSTAVVIISSERDELLPDHMEQKIKGYKKNKIFKTSTGIFRYRPIVKIYYIEDNLVLRDKLNFY